MRKGVSSPEHPQDDRDAAVPLRKLVELALVHPEIGPPLADLAFAIGHKETGDQLLRMGTDRQHPQLEYFVVAAHAARRARRYPDALRATADALRVYAAAEAGAYGTDEAERLLQLIRTGLSVLMFDLKDVNAEPELTNGLAATLPGLEDRLGEQPLYRSLLAQALWFVDKDASEKEWERSRELGDVEGTWNARGTWYKEAEKDLEKAERTYRKGLERLPQSALLMHNLAQVLVERAEKATISPGQARHLLNQAQDLLRRSLQSDAPRLRRHIHATRDRLEALRRTLPPPERPPEREAPPPAPPPPPQHQQARPPQDNRDNRDNRDRDNRGPRRGPPPQRERPPERKEAPGQQFLTKGTVSLADLIMAKLKDKGST
jgi:tetratricopeptide (TPR) repeat protein